MAAKSFEKLHLGDKVDCIVAVLRDETSAIPDKKPLLKIHVSDCNGIAILAKRWEATEDEIQDAKIISWAHVVGEVTTYQGTLEIRLVHPLREVDEPEGASSFIPSSPLTLDDLRARLQFYVESVQHPQLKALLRAVFVDDVKLTFPFEMLPAAEIRHHAFRHGLIQHTLEVTDVVDSICTKHKTWGAARGRLSRDLAVTGALLHDIGKIEEYEQYRHGVVFTKGGGLLGHVTLGIVRIARKIATIRNNKAIGFDDDLEKLVLHLITAHHGKCEYGAPVVPKMAEAALIHYADMISTECFYFAEAQKNAAEDDIEFKQWKMENRRVYVAKFDCLWGEQVDVEPVENGVLAPEILLSAGAEREADNSFMPNASMPSRSRLSLPLLRLVRDDAPNNFLTAHIPLVGQVAAGQPILDTANIEEAVCIEADGLYLDRGKYYLLRVQGDSMTGDDINDGDLIVVRHQEQAEWGDMVVALIDGGATVKRLAKKSGQVQLEASNPAYAPIPVSDPATLHIQGRVVAVAR